ncbi:MAG: GNAT family N-acetyltransferase [Defluviitaleaceae bacterium]|nr:GNAT family N-acetyltransferase [Defluviitaleaceae bacterium]
MRFIKKIEGPRLYLSPFDQNGGETLSLWVRWMNDPAVAEMYGGRQNNASVENAKKTLGGLQGRRFDVVLSEGDLPVGHASLHDVDHLNRNAFVGIFISGEEHRGRGYGAEAIKLMLGYAFLTQNLHCVALSVHADNLAAIACYKKSGFRESGRRIEWIYKNGGYVDKVYMEILDREYLAGK